MGPHYMFYDFQKEILRLVDRLYSNPGMRYASVYYHLTFVPDYRQYFIQFLVEILQNKNIILLKFPLYIVTNTKD